MIPPRNRGEAGERRLVTADLPDVHLMMTTDHPTHHLKLRTHIKKEVQFKTSAGRRPLYTHMH